MKEGLKFAIIAAAVAIAGHAVVIAAAPRFIMGVAMKRLSDGGLRTNVWLHAPRTDETARRVVRPSPDLAYSACVYDVKKAPIPVTAAPWDDYMSVSVHAANSDNVVAVDDRQAPAGVKLWLVSQRDSSATPAGFRRVVSPTYRGIILERRLAPTPERFAKAAAARANDICGEVPRPRR